MNYIYLNGENLTIEQVIEVAYHHQKITIDETAKKRVQESRDFLETEIKSGKILYAINTGFGANASTLIPHEKIADLQKKLLLSHACGVGKRFNEKMTRAIMVIRLNTLLAGFSGIRLQTIEMLCNLLNFNILPIIPSQGSVGASGDLCPLSHMALPLIGEGKVIFDKQKMTAKKALKINALSPIELAEKEGIALNNGTSVMTALGVIGVYESKKMLDLSTQASAMFFEGLMCRNTAFDEKIHQVRRHKGQQEIATKIRNFTKNSTLLGIKPIEIIKNIPSDFTKNFNPHQKNELEDFIEGKKNEFSTLFYNHLPIETSETWQHLKTLFQLATKKTNPQDSYSVRCTPQVLGASLSAIDHVEQIISQELNAVVDNPLLFIKEKQILSGGNFHGQPIALALDYLKLAVAEIGNLLERQVCKLVDASQNDFLPPFLVKNAGLNSGFMILQYTCASLVSENKVLVHPASADSIPTSANQEDHVSMGPIAGRQALEILENVKKILSILLLTATQALDLRIEQLSITDFEIKLGENTKILREKIRNLVPYWEDDRLAEPDIRLILKHLKNL
ncbi:MAG: histidine ammonia-lyase [Bacteroidetes bacterium]|nr:MAG: histidine ammonia-lyase [Bacteroidota bacterium]